MVKLVKTYFILGIVILITPIAYCSFFTINEGKSLSANPEEAAADWSPNGNLLAIECFLEGSTRNYAEGGGVRFSTSAADICLVDPNGENLIQLTNESGEDRFPMWSPDGSKIAFTRADGIYTVDVKTKSRRRLVHLPHADFAAMIGKVEWSSDSSQLLFSACLTENADRDIHIVDVDTGALTTLTSENDKQDFYPQWTLDGTKLIFWSSVKRSETVNCFFEDEGVFELILMSTDDKQERVIHSTNDPGFSFAVTNSGQLAFIEKTNEGRYLYTLDINEGVPTKRTKVASWRMRWSPNENLLAYDSSNIGLLDLQTGEVQNFDFPFPLLEYIDSWSPNNQEVAVTVGVTSGFSYFEKHILIFDTQDGKFRRLIPR